RLSDGRGHAGNPRPGQRQPRRGAALGDAPRPAPRQPARGVETLPGRHRRPVALPSAPAAGTTQGVPEMVGAMAGHAARSPGAQFPRQPPLMFTAKRYFMAARTLEIRGNLEQAYADVFTPQAMAALEALAALDADRKALMAARIQRRAAR